MLYYDRVGVFGRINVNKTSVSKVYHYCQFLSFIFKFRPNVNNRCHGLLRWCES